MTQSRSEELFKGVKVARNNLSQFEDFVTDKCSLCWTPDMVFSHGNIVYIPTPNTIKGIYQVRSENKNTHKPPSTNRDTHLVSAQSEQTLKFVRSPSVGWKSKGMDKIWSDIQIYTISDRHLLQHTSELEQLLKYKL